MSEENHDALLAQLLDGSLDEAAKINLQKQLREHAFHRTSAIRVAYMHGLLIESNRINAHHPSIAGAPGCKKDIESTPQRTLRPAIVIPLALAACLLLATSIFLIRAYVTVSPRILHGSIANDTTPISQGQRLKFDEMYSVTINNTAINLATSRITLQQGTKFIINGAGDIALLTGSGTINAHRPTRIHHAAGTIVIEHGEANYQASITTIHIELITGAGSFIDTDGTIHPLAPSKPIHSTAVSKPIAHIIIKPNNKQQST